MNANSSPRRRRLEDPPWIEGRDRLAEAAFRVSRGWAGRRAERPAVLSSRWSTSSSRLEVDLTSQSHESAGRRSYCRIRRTGSEVEHMHDRAADLLPPGENHEFIANGDCFVLDGVGEADIVARDDLHRQLALGVNGDARR